MRNLLVAFDGSKCALSAVDYVGMQFSGPSDIKITIFYVLPSLPPYFWDDGHILSPDEREERKRVVEKWLSNQSLRMEPLFDKARQMLIERGINADQIETKVKSDVADVAGSILEEARTGGYSTLVVGRCGFSHKERYFTGSTTTAIINRGAGLAICVVE
jgi:nucleotide-binding universal stress UspA family protein